jgi:hypothetical protein
MAFEELVQLLSKTEAVDAKQDEVMRLFMLATAEMLLSGELTPGDPEWKAIAARGEALGLKVLAKAAGSVETFTRMWQPSSRRGPAGRRSRRRIEGWPSARWRWARAPRSTSPSCAASAR